jgi:hypothetical protein
MLSLLVAHRMALSPSWAGAHVLWERLDLSGARALSVV